MTVTNNLNIFELTNLQIQLKNWFDKYNDAEFDEETLNKYLMITEETKEKFIEKVKNYYYFIRRLEYLVQNAKEEKERINKIQKTYENTIEKLKFILRNSMESSNETKIEFETGKIFLKSNPDKINVKIVSMEEIPEEFIKIEKIINKSAINQKYKNVDDLPNWLEKIKSEKSLILK